MRICCINRVSSARYRLRCKWFSIDRLPVQLTELTKNRPARVATIRDERDGDPIAQRLRDLGFIAGEPICIVARAPFGGDPLLVRIGGTRFALRRVEAARITVEPDIPES